MSTDPGARPAIAVMQPYFFPYLGTYQLAAAVDEFVFFDDVAFIKKGYIHRNALLLDGSAHPFSVPVRGVSQNRTIREHEYAGDWRGFLALVASAYRKAPHFDAAMPLVESIALDPDENVARKNALTLQRVFDHVGIERRWSFSSETPAPTLRGQDRILDLCRLRGARTYVNAAGGRALYAPAAFEDAGIELRFLRTLPHAYPQRSADFVTNLSMIDLLMHCTTAEIAALLSQRAVEA
jgi:hypothetical protein